MSLSLTDHRRCRGSAKGTITKVAREARTLSSVSIDKLDVALTDKQLELLDKADDAFRQHHQAICDGDDDISEDQSLEELLDHQSTVAPLREVFQGLRSMHEATVIARELSLALDDLELSMEGDYSSSMDLDFDEAQSLCQQLRKARAKPATGDCPHLKSASDAALRRLRAVQKVRDTARALSTSMSSDSSEASVSTRVATHIVSPLRLKLPTFDGTFLNWRNYEKLHSSVIDKELQLSDHEKCCHLVQSMGTPECKAHAEAAIANTSSYDEAMARMKEIYERNRVLQTHHLADLLKPDTFKDEKKDLTRMMSRLESNVRGMKLAKGYTLDQAITTHYETLMAPPLVKQWRKFTMKYDDPPPLQELLTFLKNQIRAAPDIMTVPKEKETPAKHSSHPKRTILRTDQKPDKCTMCQSDHSLYTCPQLRQKSTRQRRDWVKSAGLCFNCLSPRHRSSDCSSRHRCRECSAKHHTLLHESGTPSGSESAGEQATVNLTTNLQSIHPYCSIPSTAIITVRAGGLAQRARAQMDSGATISLVSRALANTIKARRLPNSSTRIRGVGGTISSSHQVEITLIGNEGELFDSVFHVVDSIPSTSSHADVRQALSLPFLSNLQLADPNYSSSAHIDMLLDMGTTNRCSKDGVLHSPDRSLKAENTVFGWTVGGHHSQPLQSSDSTPTCLRVTVNEDDPNFFLKKFWDLDQFPSDQQPLSSEDQQAVDHFNATFTRDPNGRYRVSLPKKTPTPQLGRSRETARLRYLSNERSLLRRGTLTQFNDIVTEYGDLGHAEVVPEEDLDKPGECIFVLPMHGVTKLSSSSTKLRVVFDASAPSSNGVSLNDTLLTGPSLYPMLSSVICQFRTYAIGMTADITKMFREVGLADADKDLHRFLHRGPDGELRDWRMSRLTFGVSSSPYLASQVLLQLATDHQEEFPLAARVVHQQFYVDDCITGAATLEEAQEIQRQLVGLFQRAMMVLCKWRSNSNELLDSIPVALRETSNLSINVSPDLCGKTLGIHWSTRDDSLHVSTPEVQPNEVATKRKIASAVARTFDIMGWLSPATLPAKVLLQEAWSTKLGWDDSLPPSIQTRWQVWLKELPSLTDLPIPRLLGLPNKTIISRQLHGFADASTLAYGGTVYLRSFYFDTTVTVDLVSSKVRVAPLKTTTIPRLELCGALLLSQILDTVANDLSLPASDIFAWSDSSAVLGWINQTPSKLSIFVANRVHKLTALVSPTQWRYVSTLCNPADLLSRGISPLSLRSSSLWWDGPPWLSQDPSQWPRRPDINLSRELPELRHIVLHVSSAPTELVSDVSDFNRKVRVMAWVKRFCLLHRPNQEPLPTTLTLEELSQAKLSLLRNSQRIHFHAELKRLEAKQPLPLKHPLAGLVPYLDPQGLLRVGGRLQKANLEQSQKHPLILSHKSVTVSSMIRGIHQRLLHAGPSTMMSALAPNFHIPQLKRLLRKLSRTCITCQRVYARATTQRMGELPATRLTPARPFSEVGLDFAGPLMTKQGNSRKPTYVKTYVCVYICFASRAIHLEVVSNLSTEAFMGCLSRFVSRRGLPTRLHSDNGTNFTGAQAELRAVQQLLRSEDSKEVFTLWSAQNDVVWDFTPARAPHFGGLWEAAVRSMKTLLRKTIGERSLTIEELMTVVTEAEAVLNSRPLLQTHSPADDGLPPLTPGHFLVGGPLCALPSRPDTQTKLPLLRRWNLVKRLSHDIWTRWLADYVSQLQRRAKWRHPKRQMRVNDLVLVKDADTFQRVWPIARVSATYPGRDGLVRVVDICRNGKVYRRPVVKLALVLEESEEDSPRGEDVEADEVPVTLPDANW